VYAMKMRIGLQKKAIAGISALLMALAVSLMAISVYQGSDEIRAQLMKRGMVSVENLGYNATYPTVIRDTASLGAFLDGIMADKEVVYCSIRDVTNTELTERYRPAAELARMDLFGKAGHPDEIYAELKSRVAAISTSSDLDRYVEDGDLAHFRVPIMIDHSASSELGSELELYELGGGVSRTNGEENHRETIGYALIGMTTYYAEETIADLRDKMMWITAVAILLAMVVVSIAARLSIRPINELVVATGRVADGDYDCKVREGRNDEVGDLAKSFNKMTADLKESRDALVEKELLEALVVELRETQEQLVQAGKLAALGQLAAGVAHEINNPLAGIMGYAQLLTEKLKRRSAEGIAAEDVPKYVAYVESMEKQSQRCKYIVQSLLKFARVSTQEESVAVDCNAVLRETLTLIAHQLSQNNITVKSEYSDTLPPIQGQEGKLQQVLTNIIINAMQSIDGGGTITTSTAMADNHVVISVTDTGVGIPEENFDKIFDPFFTTKELGKGTGLGLSVTYGLVQDMGGRIDIHSTVGVGSTFSVLFPVMMAEDVPTDRLRTFGNEPS